MSDQKIGQCLPLYLKNRLLLSALQDDNDVPADSDEDKKLLAQFRERASEQAVGLLEDLYTSITGSISPYRCERRSQRRTVRDQWYVGGRLLRPRERIARAYGDLYLGCLRDKGPAITFIVGPQDAGSPGAINDLATKVESALGLGSANARDCFAPKADYDAGVVISYAPLTAGASQQELVKTMKEHLNGFFAKFSAELEAAIEA